VCVYVCACGWAGGWVGGCACFRHVDVTHVDIIGNVISENK